jgi:FKBP-type peptidyl-prolyl cis-trans isomerase
MSTLLPLRYGPVGLACFLSCFIAACSSSPFPGYTDAGNGYYMHLIQFGDSGRKINPGDLVTIGFAEFDADGKHKADDEGLPTSGRITLKADHPGQFMEQLAQLSLGDSASIIQSSGGKAGTRMEVRVLKVQTAAEYEAWLNHLREFGDIEEHRALEKYIAVHKITAEPIENGLYLIPEKEGSGDSVKAGKTVSIAYKGYFLDGYQFDGTTPGQPLEFPYGKEMQVIEGLHLAIGRMKAGDKSKIIIPSHFAYGEKGSSTGIVPPFTTVIYEVEIVHVK